MSSFKGQEFKERLAKNLYLASVYIPSGTFWMGSPEGEEERCKDESPQHKVKVPGFWMGKYTVTQAQWRAVAALPKVKMDLDPESSYFKGDNRPVESVSWYEAIEFCVRLTKHTGHTYRLPSEAEWEYACRAHTTTPFYFGKTITPDLANYDGNNGYRAAPNGQYRKATTDVGSFPPNGFGLYDMHGNVWEWCLDYWHENYEGAPTNGSVWEAIGEYIGYVIRGGSWYSYPFSCRSAYRDWGTPNFSGNKLGFRVVTSLSRRINLCYYF